jgi:hypothetical protein
MKVAYYQAPISGFLSANESEILGELTLSHGFVLEQEQRNAWLEQIPIMQQAVRNFTAGHILFEFVIPRMGKRADVVLVIGGTILVLEFKSVTKFEFSAIEQAHDYALDLKNFHLGSHELPIVPIVVATRARPVGVQKPQWAPDMVAAPVLASAEELPLIINRLIQNGGDIPIDFERWVRSGYQPTPTIVEAAQALYQQHGVEEIARSDAGVQNLGLTSACIAEVIEKSKAEGRKSICLVTGVPGSGKTLAGLNIATKRAQEHSDEHAVFLSGNGPLVEVLREALARDDCKRTGISKKDALRKVASFIQNIHHFRDEALRNPKPPYERVVVFDEAQRAWTRDQTAKFMHIKRGLSTFDMSEPEFLISVMDRHVTWCVIVCLIGGGQEINTGEAGLVGWSSALKERFTHWDVYISNRLSDPDYAADQAAVETIKTLHVAERNELHLAVSMRSFRAEALSAFVGHVVENRAVDACRVYSGISERYPIWLTRDLDQVRRWLKKQARGSERYGLLASSGGDRLRPEGLHVKAEIHAPTWFLNDRSDVRSSFYCEEVATEFDVQGLELDWVGVSWDADFRYGDRTWRFLKFRGTRWQQVNTAEGQLYLKNAYRVILTRARQGMIIFVPRGAAEDATRVPAYYDQTYQFLRNCGLRELRRDNPISHYRHEDAGDHVAA